MLTIPCNLHKVGGVSCGYIGGGFGVGIRAKERGKLSIVFYQKGVNSKWFYPNIFPNMN